MNTFTTTLMILAPVADAAQPVLFDPATSKLTVPLEGYGVRIVKLGPATQQP